MGWLETYRGTVYRWEVDHVDHFTVAYYFARFQEATEALLAALGLDAAALGTGGAACRVEHCHVRYLRELRTGDVLHIRSGVASAEPGGLTLVHEVYDSGDGTRCSTVEQRARVVGPDGTPGNLGDTQLAAVQAAAVSWQAPAGSSRPAAAPPGGAGFLDTARDLVKPAEVDVRGRATWAACVHRFSAANGHVLAAFGMTPAYMRAERRGFSTFEFHLALPGELRAGDLVAVRSAVLHVGSSSLRLLHRLADARTGRVAAILEQAGVHLDLGARRPTPLPDALRERASELAAAGR